MKYWIVLERNYEYDDCYYGPAYSYGETYSDVKGLFETEERAKERVKELTKSCLVFKNLNEYYIDEKKDLFKELIEKGYGEIKSSKWENEFNRTKDIDDEFIEILDKYDLYFYIVKEVELE